MLRIFFAILFIGSPATAQSVDWFDAQGRFALGYSNHTTGADAFLVGDATARLSFDRVGVELGIFGRADALDTPHETYGALTLDIGQNGRLSVGVPRPAYDMFAVSKFDTAFPSLAINRTQQTRSAATFGAMFGGRLPFGASFTNSTAGVDYALSIHTTRSPGDTIVSIGLRGQINDVALSGAIETVGGDVGAKLQISGDIGQTNLGLTYFAPSAAGVGDLAEVFARYDINDRWSISGIAQLPLDGGSPTGGISTGYKFRDNMAVNLGVASDAGSDAVISGFLSVSF